MVSKKELRAEIELLKAKIVLLEERIQKLEGREQVIYRVGGTAYPPQLPLPPYKVTCADAWNNHRFDRTLPVWHKMF